MRGSRQPRWRAPAPAPGCGRGPRCPGRSSRDGPLSGDAGAHALLEAAAEPLELTPQRLRKAVAETVEEGFGVVGLPQLHLGVEVEQLSPLRIRHPGAAVVDGVAGGDLAERGVDSSRLP